MKKSIKILSLLVILALSVTGLVACNSDKGDEKALEYGVKVTGATAHYVNEVCDGGKIIAQKAVAIEEGDTPEILQKRVMEQAEWEILPKAIDCYANGKIKIVDGRVIVSE